MFKTQIIGHLGHDNRLFDVQCKEHGIFNSREVNGICPKCQQPVVSITAANNRAMTISEGTIYPTRTKKEEEYLAQNLAKRKNSLPPTYRFVLFSFAHPETGVLMEPPVHQYLTKGREVMVEVNSEPVISYFVAKDESYKSESRYVIIPGAGDKIKLLGKKEVQPTAQPVNQPAGVTSTNATMTADTATQVAALQAQLARLIAAQPKPPVSQAVNNESPSLFPDNDDDDDPPF